MHQRLRNFALVFIVTSLSTPAITQDRSAYKDVDHFVKDFPLKPSGPDDIRSMAGEIKRQFTTIDERARAVYTWIINNISYDWEGYRSGAGIWALEEVLKQRKAVCEGYARLMKFFCDELEVPCTVIYGFATGIGEFPGPDDVRTNHAWNAVKIDGEWKLIDATWGSEPSNELYFYTDPAELITTHFPDSAQWQLLPVSYTKEQFSDLVIRRQVREERELASVGITIKTLVETTVGDYVRFKIKSRDTLNRVSIGIYNKKDGVDYRFDSISYAGKGEYYYDFLVPRTGNYQVDVSGFFMNDGAMGGVGTHIDSYFLEVAPRPKSASSTKKARMSL